MGGSGHWRGPAVEGMRHIVLALSFGLLAWMSAGLFSLGAVGSIVWPPAGLALAFLLLGGPRYWPGIFLGSLAAALIGGSHPLPATLSAAGNALSAWLACRLAQSRFPTLPTLSSLGDFTGLLLVGAAAAVVSAVFGVGGYALHGAVAPERVLHRMLLWWQGDLLGILLLTPALLLAAPRRGRWPPFGLRWAAWLFLAVALAIGQIIYTGWLAPFFGVYAREYWAFLFVTLAALTLGRTVTALFVLMTAIQLLAGIGLGIGNLGHGFDQHSLAGAWMFLLALTITGMAAAILVHERGRARRMLESSDRRRRRMLDAMAEGLLLQDATGAVLESNPSAQRIVGLSAEEIAARVPLDPEWQTIRPDGSRMPMDERPARIARYTGQPVRDAVLGVYHSSGRLTWLSVNAEPLFDDRGVLEGVVSTYVDITRLQQSIDSLTANAELLSRQEKFLGVIVENVPAMIAYYTRDLRCSFANARYREWFGLKDADFRNADMRALLGEEMFAAREPFIEAVLRGEPQTMERSIVDRHGVHADVIVQYFPDAGDEGVRGFIVLLHDVTSIRKSTADRMQLAAIVESADDAIVSTSLDGVVSSWNNGAERMFGCRLEDAIGRRVEDLFRAGTPGMWQRILARVARGEHVRFEHEVQHHAGAAAIHAGFTVSPVCEEGSAVAGASWIIRDVTEQVRAETELLALNAELDQRVEDRTRELQEAKDVAEAAVQARSRFIATVSHEIRTPLNAILGMCHLALESVTDERQRDYLQKMRMSGDHLLSLINNLLDFSKVDSGKLVLEHVSFGLDVVLDTVMILTGPRLQGAGRRCVLDVGADVPLQLRGDPLRLGQMLINYANNAVKFSEVGDVIVRVRLLERTLDDALLLFEVLDSGVGIPSAVRGELFRPFHQADASTSRRFGGTGLGLAITAQIAALMGGEVGVDSEEGAGSRFWFTVRLQVDAPVTAPEPEPEEAAGEQPLLGRRILLVEDSAFNQQVGLEMLRMAGAEVVVAGSGQEALDMLFAGTPFDCVLMDMQMPDMDGVETTRRLKADPRFAGLPVLALTANVSSNDRVRCLDAGMVDFISKPVRPADLYRRIAGALAARPVTVPENDPVIDLAALRTYIGDRPGAVSRYVSMFLGMAARKLGEAHEACVDGRMQDLAAIGHQMKSSALQVGAHGFAEICRQLEADAGSMAAGEARRRLAQLDILHARIAAFLENHVNGGG